MERYVSMIMVYVSLFAGAQPDFSVVRSHLESGRTHEAGSSLDSLSGTGPKDSVLYYRSILKLQEGRPEAARTDIEALARMSPGNGELSYLWGLLFYHESRYARAVESFSEYLLLHPSHVKSLLNRSLSLGLMDNFDEAIADLDVVLKADPSHSEAWYSRGYWNEFAGRYDEAARSYEKCIGLSPRSYDAYLGLAFSYHRLHDDVRACEAIEKAVKAGSQIAAEVKDNYCR